MSSNPQLEKVDEYDIHDVTSLPEVRSFYERNGFVILRVLDRHACDELVLEQWRSIIFKQPWTERYRIRVRGVDDRELNVNTPEDKKEFLRVVTAPLSNAVREEFERGWCFHRGFGACCDPVVFHLPLVWEVRQNPNLYRVASNLIGVRELWVDLNRSIQKLPGQGEDESLHWDFNPFTHQISTPKHHSICGKVCYTKGRFVAVPGSHLPSFQKQFADHYKEYYPDVKSTARKFTFQSDRPDPLGLLARQRRYEISPGCIIFWNPRLLHCQTKLPLDEPIEYGCFIGFMPAIPRTEYQRECGINELEDRKKSYQLGCGPKLWPNLEKVHFYPKRFMNFPKILQSYVEKMPQNHPWITTRRTGSGATVPHIEPQLDPHYQPPQLSPLGQRLLGLLPWPPPEAMPVDHFIPNALGLGHRSHSAVDQQSERGAEQSSASLLPIRSLNYRPWSQAETALRLDPGTSQRPRMVKIGGELNVNPPPPPSPSLGIYLTCRPSPNSSHTPSRSLPQIGEMCWDSLALPSSATRLEGQGMPSIIPREVANLCADSAPRESIRRPDTPGPYEQGAGGLLARVFASISGQPSDTGPDSGGADDGDGRASSQQGQAYYGQAGLESQSNGSDSEDAALADQDNNSADENSPPVPRPNFNWPSGAGPAVQSSFSAAFASFASVVQTEESSSTNMTELMQESQQDEGREEMEDKDSPSSAGSDKPQQNGHATFLMLESDPGKQVSHKRARSQDQAENVPKGPTRQWGVALTWPGGTEENSNTIQQRPVRAPPGTYVPCRYNFWRGGAETQFTPPPTNPHRVLLVARREDVHTLKQDLELYANEFRRHDIEVETFELSRETRSVRLGPERMRELERFRERLNWCTSLIGFEFLGDAHTWADIISRRRSASGGAIQNGSSDGSVGSSGGSGSSRNTPGGDLPPLKVVLVPNLEFSKLSNDAVCDTMANLSEIDILVAKTEDIYRRLHTFFLNRRFTHGGGNLVLVPHTTPLSHLAAAAAYGSPPIARDRVIHFPGSGKLKNTAENCAAAAILVREFPALLGGGLVIKCCHPKRTWRSTGGRPPVCQECDIARWRARQPEAFAGVAVTVVDGRLTDENKAALYSRCRLAVCASEAEGFGHCVLEAAAHGCQVLTTDGDPMRSVLMRQVGLAVPTGSSEMNLGLRYRVPRHRIAEAGRKLLRQCLYSPEECHRNWLRRNDDFSDHFSHLIAALSYNGSGSTEPELRCRNPEHHLPPSFERRRCFGCGEAMHAELRPVNAQSPDRPEFICPVCTGNRDSAYSQGAMNGACNGCQQTDANRRDAWSAGASGSATAGWGEGSRRQGVGEVEGDACDGSNMWVSAGRD